MNAKWVSGIFDQNMILSGLCYCFWRIRFILLFNGGFRLQNVAPINYVEVDMVKKGKSLKDEDILLEEGSKPEFYTEEHEKLLGNTEKSWTLFVDGYGKDGKRIYDQFRGKTCHQCRSDGFLRRCMTSSPLPFGLQTCRSF